MKKFLILLLIVIGAAFAQVKAQTVLPSGKYAVEYTGVSSDTVGAATVTTWNKGWVMTDGDAVFYNAKVKVADKAANGACTIALQGKYFTDDTYTTITTLTWHATGTDTTVLFTGNTNKVYYRYFNFLVTRTASSAKVIYTKLSLKK